MSSPSESIATRSMIYLGMDVHKESITIAVLPPGAKTPTRLDRLANDLPKLKRWLDRIARDGELRSVTKRAVPDTCCTAQYRSGDMPARSSRRRSSQSDRERSASMISETLPTLPGFIERAS